MCVIKYSKVYTRYDASPFSQNVAVVFIMCVFSGLYLTIDWYWTNSTTRSICLCGLHTLKMMSKRIKYIYTASFWHKHCILRRLCLPTLQEYFFLKAWKGRIYNFWHVLHTLSEGLERIGICFLKNSGSSKKTGFLKRPFHMFHSIAQLWREYYMFSWNNAFLDRNHVQEMLHNVARIQLCLWKGYRFNLLKQLHTERWKGLSID
jgi:hypothetical protein